MLHPGKSLNEHLRVRYVHMVVIKRYVMDSTGQDAGVSQLVVDCTFNFAAAGLGTVSDVASPHTRSIRLLVELSRTSA